MNLVVLIKIMLTIGRRIWSVKRLEHLPVQRLPVQTSSPASLSSMSTSVCQWASLVQGQGLLCAIGKPGIVPYHLDDVAVDNDDDDEYDTTGALVMATVKEVGLILPIHDTNCLASTKKPDSTI